MSKTTILVSCFSLLLIASSASAAEKTIASHRAGATTTAQHCSPGESTPSASAPLVSTANTNADKLLARFVTESLSVSGAVKHPLTLKVEDLKKFPQQKINTLQMVCLSGANMEKMENVRGILLRDIFEKAELDAPGHNDVKHMYILATASDGYKVLFSWAEVFNSPLSDGIIVYYEKNNAPLGNDEGRIAMVSTKDTKTGPRHVKWLKSLEIRKVD